MKSLRLALCLLLGGLLPVWSTQAAPLKALIVDGQNNHNWETTTPYLQQLLEATGRFSVEVATTPPAGADMSAFHPRFSEYDVVVSNYNGATWPEAVRQAFEAFVQSGGGFVPVHAANNAFPDWPAYNEMIGLGGWGGRDEKSGPYLRYRDGKMTRDTSPGRGGSHGAQHEFVVEIRNPDHPITRGLPQRWLHAQDELYDRLRGPARNLTVLATAYSDPKTRGSGEHEPMLMTIRYGKGRVFHTTLGHNGRNQPLSPALKSVDFIVTFQRGTEWAASGKVTLPLPERFPTPESVLLRD